MVPSIPTWLDLDAPKISFQVLGAILTSAFYPMPWSKIACSFALLDEPHVAPSLLEISPGAFFSLTVGRAEEPMDPHGNEKTSRDGGTKREMLERVEGMAGPSE